MSFSYSEGFDDGEGSIWTCTFYAAAETHSDYTLSEKSSVFGGQDDLLGISDIGAINSPDFGIVFTATAGANGAVVAVDTVRVKVFYVDDITAGVKSTTRPDGLASVAYGEGNVVVIVGMKGEILRSTDSGATWSTVSSGILADLFRVVKTPQGFLTVGDRGAMLQSTDNGVTWSQIASGTLSELRSVVYNGGDRAVAIASDGIVLSSRNYTTWSIKR